MGRFRGHESMKSSHRAEGKRKVKIREEESGGSGAQSSSPGVGAVICGESIGGKIANSRGPGT